MKTEPYVTGFIVEGHNRPGPYIGELGTLHYSCKFCGGKMVPHRSKLFVWVCEHYHWWKPWAKHDKIGTFLEVESGDER
jgi:hypothetical protein